MSTQGPNQSDLPPTDPAPISSASSADPPESQPLPQGAAAPQFTVRAILTGMTLGAIFSACNIYIGLRLGVAINMSLVAVVLSYALWMGLSAASAGRVRRWGVIENNISQTACSSGSLVASAGLVAPIPALALLTGTTLSWPALALWVFSVCLVGIVVAITLRPQLLLRDRLPFPMGTATAELLREMHSRGREALARVSALLAGAAVACAATLSVSFWRIKALGLPFSLAGIKARTFTLGLEPSLFYVGIGGLVGIRTGASLLLGAAVAFGVLAPILVTNGTIELSGNLTPSTLSPNAVIYRDLQRWLVWPGVTLMIVAALASFAFSWRSVVALVASAKGSQRQDNEAHAESGLSSHWYAWALVAVLLLSVVLQVALFKIAWWVAVISVALAFVLAIVATRVSGETGITPVGKVSKIAQLSLGALTPQNVAANLMAANVAGGAGSQSADLMDDLKCGHLLGTPPRSQFLAQVCGALVGAVAGSAVYMFLIHDPQQQLMTDQWPAPGVAMLKSVAELFQTGFHTLPPATTGAMLIAAGAALVLVLLEKLLPKAAARFVPSPASIGLAFVIPAWSSLAIFLGALLSLVMKTWLPAWKTRFWVALCAGLVAGQVFTEISQLFIHVLAQRG